jgi:transposase
MLRTNPHRRYSPQRPWEPLSDDEWAVLSPFVHRHTAGRPVRDPRGRLDAIFWLSAQPGRALPPWADLPPEFGKPDTASRQFRRWAAAGLWTRLLEALADPGHPGIAVLRRLESWICRSYRRAWRLLGVAGAALARRLGFLSALRGPSWLLPDPDLSGWVLDRLAPVLERVLRGDLRPPPPGFLAACAHLLGAAGGRRSIPRCLAPP